VVARAAVVATGVLVGVSPQATKAPVAAKPAKAPPYLRNRFRLILFCSSIKQTPSIYVKLLIAPQEIQVILQAVTTRAYQTLCEVLNIAAYITA
jgi:hypothetical protein